jgi:centrosomal protein CEP76
MVDYVSLKRIGDGKSLEIWNTMHTILSAKRGDIQDHCVLLCNLFLGFHLDAYVTIGTDNENNPHTWVTTLNANGQVYFWESLTGTRYTQQDQHHFRTIGCLFNNCSLFANIQVNDVAQATKFSLNDPSMWKKLTPPSRPSIPFSLRYTPMDTLQKAIEIEMELSQSIEFYRLDHHLSCVWDEDLAQLLTQSLWSMEHSKLVHTSYSFSDDFHIGIQSYLPEGHTFKGFPFCFNHLNPQKMFSQMQKSKKCKDIILSRGDCVRMAVRVLVRSFSDGVVSAWVMVASRSLI